MKVRHTIEAVGFQEAAERGRPSSEAVLRCSCGTVTTSGQWDAHRGLTASQTTMAQASRMLRRLAA